MQVGHLVSWIASPEVREAGVSFLFWELGLHELGILVWNFVIIYV